MKADSILKADTLRTINDTMKFYVNPSDYELAAAHSFRRALVDSLTTMQTKVKELETMYRSTGEDIFARIANLKDTAIVYKEAIKTLDTAINARNEKIEKLLSDCNSIFKA